MENLLDKLAGLSHWQIDLLTAGILIESAILPVVPEEAILLTLGTLILQGRVGPFEAFAFYQVGAVTADLILLGFGRLASHGMNRHPFLAKLIAHPTTILAQSLIRRHAKALIFFTRFIPTVRSPVYIAAGASHVSYRSFALTDWAASCFHIPLLMGVGYYVARVSGSPEGTLRSLAWVFASLLGGGVTITLILKRRARDRSKTAKTDH